MTPLKMPTEVCVGLIELLAELTKLADGMAAAVERVTQNASESNLDDLYNAYVRYINFMEAC